EIGQGRMDVGEGDARIIGDDLVRALPASLVRENDVLDGDPVPGDARLSSARPGRAHDTRSVLPRGLGRLWLGRCLVHDPHLTAGPPTGKLEKTRSLMAPRRDDGWRMTDDRMPDLHSGSCPSCA